MPENWNLKKLRNFISAEIEESLTLEYKSGEALGKSDYQKKEITKDVSAMANSAGGLLIYGIREFSETEKRHLPEKIIPVDRSEFPREWIEQIINSIRPRIEGILIHSVQLDSGENDVAYIIEIPQSNTAHQANNHRYYKRFNFQSVPMEDYEVRDVMFREQTPDVAVRFLIELVSRPAPGRSETGNDCNLIIEARNTGSSFAQYVACLLDVPVEILFEVKNKINLKDGGRYYRHRLFNLNQEFGDENFKANFPLLRNMSMSWKIPLKDDLEEIRNKDLELKWKIFADNALPKEGRISVGDIEIVDLRRKAGS
ncbi:MAG: ATP-binding protein [Acidobacteria bacterium]|nr:ATP-binding protein [Acidobacteriota bacterium]